MLDVRPSTAVSWPLQSAPDRAFLRRAVGNRGKEIPAGVNASKVAVVRARPKDCLQAALPETGKHFVAT